VSSKYDGAKLFDTDHPGYTSWSNRPKPLTLEEMREKWQGMANALKMRPAAPVQFPRSTPVSPQFFHDLHTVYADMLNMPQAERDGMQARCPRCHSWPEPLPVG